MKKYDTAQRKQLLAFFEAHCHEQFSIDEIVAALSEKEPIERSVVYRNVDRMLREGLLHKSARENSRKFYYQYVGSSQCHKRLHLQCTECGRIFHIENQADEEQIKQVLRNNGLLLDEQKTVLMGPCRRCGEHLHKPPE
ncbi:MAG: transcriptional repressor [Firmicutes bacterium]|nr:transcriptional repressor [Bacillota bacterium]